MRKARGMRGLGARPGRHHTRQLDLMDSPPCQWRTTTEGLGAANLTASMGEAGKASTWV